MFKKVIPAIGDFKTLEIFLKSPHDLCVVLNFRLTQLVDIVKKIKEANKKVLVHAELIRGLSNDEEGALYLIQNLQVEGIISSKPRVIELCKKRNTIGVYRFFLKDSLSLNQSLSIAKQIEPDYIEVLPYQGANLINRLNEIVPSTYFSGGLIETKEDVNYCLKHGAKAVTSSRVELWKID